MARTKQTGTKTKKATGTKKAATKTKAKKATSGESNVAGLKYNPQAGEQHFAKGEVAYVSEKLAGVTWRSGARFPTVVSKSALNKKGEDESQFWLVFLMAGEPGSERVILNMMGLPQQIEKAIDYMAKSSGADPNSDQVRELKKLAINAAIRGDNINDKRSQAIIEQYKLRRPETKKKVSYPFTIMELNAYRKQVAENKSELTYGKSGSKGGKGGKSGEGKASGGKWNLSLLKPTQKGKVTRVNAKWSPTGSVSRAERLSSDSSSTFKEIAVNVDGTEYVVQAISLAKLNELLNEYAGVEEAVNVVNALREAGVKAFNTQNVFAGQAPAPQPFNPQGPAFGAAQVGHSFNPAPFSSSTSPFAAQPQGSPSAFQASPSAFAGQQGAASLNPSAAAWAATQHTPGSGSSVGAPTHLGGMGHASPFAMPQGGSPFAPQK